MTIVSAITTTATALKTVISISTTYSTTGHRYYFHTCFNVFNGLIYIRNYEFIFTFSYLSKSATFLSSTTTRTTTVTVSNSSLLSLDLFMSAVRVCDNERNASMNLRVRSWQAWGE
jgi:hypothetical protein